MCHSNQKSVQNVFQALAWLHDMAVFYEELLIFISRLPAETKLSEMGPEPPSDVASDPAYSTLCRVSKDAEYMTGIPADLCLPALVTVQRLSREAFIAVSAHPMFSTFVGEGRIEPFFERAMILGSCLAVEHHDKIDVMSWGSAVSKGTSSAFMLGVQRSSSSSGSSEDDMSGGVKKARSFTPTTSVYNTTTTTDEEEDIQFLCDEFGIDKMALTEITAACDAAGRMEVAVY